MGKKKSLKMEVRGEGSEHVPGKANWASLHSLWKARANAKQLTPKDGEDSPLGGSVS